MRLSHHLIYYLPTPCKKDTDILFERLSEVAMCATITMDKRIERMTEVIPQLHSIVLAGYGHWVQQERAAEVNAALLAFLQEL